MRHVGVRQQRVEVSFDVRAVIFHQLPADIDYGFLKVKDSLLRKYLVFQVEVGVVVNQQAHEDVTETVSLGEVSEDAGILESFLNNLEHKFLFGESTHHPHIKLQQHHFDDSAF